MFQKPYIFDRAKYLSCVIPNLKSIMNCILLYIDPGSGSFLFQLLIAGLLAVSFYFRRIKDLISSWFKAIFSNNKAE